MSDKPNPVMGVTIHAATLIKTLPDNQTKIWSADVEANYLDGETRKFNNVLFGEQGMFTWVVGIERKEGSVAYVDPQHRKAQDSFIQWMRQETQNRLSAVPGAEHMFSQDDYSVELRTTQAFIEQRDSRLKALIGFENRQSEYELVCVGSNGEETGVDMTTVSVS